MKPRRRAEQRTAPDRLQRPLRSRFRRQVSASVRRLTLVVCMGFQEFWVCLVLMC
jgi:hypothetical protein